MKRMTTDNPQLNIERLLNTARAENNQAVLHLGDEVITLAEYVAKCAKETGCDVTLESVMDGDNCCECDCPVAILNILGIQAAENNARLKMIEKILGDEYNFDLLHEIVTAYKEGRYIIMKFAEQDGVSRLRELAEADREGRCTIFPCRDWLDLVFGEQETFYGIDMDYMENPIREITVHNEERFTWYNGWKNLVFCGVDENGIDWEFSPEEVGETVFRTKEEAEADLKARKRVGNDG